MNTNISKPISDTINNYQILWVKWMLLNLLGNDLQELIIENDTLFDQVKSDLEDVIVWNSSKLIWYLDLFLQKFNNPLDQYQVYTVFSSSGMQDLYNTLYSIHLYFQNTARLRKGLIALWIDSNLDEINNKSFVFMPIGYKDLLKLHDEQPDNPQVDMLYSLTIYHTISNLKLFITKINLINKLYWKINQKSSKLKINNRLEQIEILMYQLFIVTNKMNSILEKSKLFE